MDRADLLRALDDIAWAEHAAMEAAEDGPGDGDDDPTAEIDAALRALGARLGPADLDALEQEPGYAEWLLRLAPFVAGGAAVERAARYADDPDANVRYWARRLLG